VRGTLLGNYRVAEQLGAGGMGVVYVGRHETLGHRIAVKVLQPELSSHAGMVQRFFNEAQAATAIRNPGIVQVFDFGTTPDGRAYFVMELLEGETLAARIKQRRRHDHAEVCRLGRQIANVLQAAHAAGITHRDLKPENLFLVPDSEVIGGERVKVLDFGIAKLTGDAHPAGVKTHTGMMMGTPNYMSPEQCRSASSADARSDIYALGCILFEIACGRPPFVGGGLGDIVGAHLHEPPPLPQTLAPDIPAGLSALIVKMLAKRPDARPQTMTAVSQALDEILRAPVASPVGAQMPLPVPHPTPPLPHSPASPPAYTPTSLPARSPTPPSAYAPAPFPAPSPTPSPAHMPRSLPANAPPLPPANAPPLLAANAPPLLAANAPPLASANAPRWAPANAPPLAPANLPSLLPANAGPLLPTNSSAPASVQVSPDSTTLRGSAGMAFSQPGVAARRMPFVLGGLVIAGAVTAIALVVRHPSSADRVISYNDIADAHQPVDAAAIDDALAPPLPTPDAAPTSPDAGPETTRPMSAGDLEAECQGYAADRKWNELEQCAVKLKPLNPKRAAELKTRAVEEARSTPRIAGVAAALRDKNLKRAKSELDQVWAESVDYATTKRTYDIAEAQAISEFATQLDRAKHADCEEYNQLLAKERAANPTRVTAEAARRIPCAPPPAKCDADALSAKGAQQFASSQFAESLASFEAAYACRPAPQLILKAFVVACNLRNVAKTKAY